MALSKNFRTHNSPAPIYGIRPGFTVGDLDPQYKPMIPVFVDSLGTEQAPSTATTSSELDLASRAIKLSITVTGTGHADVQVYTKDDNFVAPIAAFTGLVAGTYDFYVGGWASPVAASGGQVYVATQYGPNGANDMALSGLNPATDNNYVGGSYNPVNYLSLDGQPIKIATANYSGSANVAIEVVGIS